MKPLESMLGRVGVAVGDDVVFALISLIVTAVSSVTAMASSTISMFAPDDEQRTPDLTRTFTQTGTVFNGTLRLWSTRTGLTGTPLSDSSTWIKPPTGGLSTYIDTAESVALQVIDEYEKLEKDMNSSEFVLDLDAALRKLLREFDPSVCSEARIFSACTKTFTDNGDPSYMYPQGLAVYESDGLSIALLIDEQGQGSLGWKKPPTPAAGAAIFPKGDTPKSYSDIRSAIFDGDVSGAVGYSSEGQPVNISVPDTLKVTYSVGDNATKTAVINMTLHVEFAGGYDAPFILSHQLKSIDIT